jgi:hypothetical protein
MPVRVNVPPPDTWAFVLLTVNLPEPCFALTDPWKLKKTAGDGSQTADANKSLPEIRYVPLKLTLPLLDQRPEGLNRKQSEDPGRPFPTTVVILAR